MYKITQNLQKLVFLMNMSNSICNKGKSIIPSASDKATLFTENFSKNYNLDDLSIFLPVFPSRTNLKLYNIPLIPKMVKNIITNLDLSKVSGADCIPVVVLKNCERELPYILAELFNKCLKEFCFPECWKVSSVFLALKNVGKILKLKTTTLLVFFLWLVKPLKNL